MTRAERLHAALDCVCDRMGIGAAGDGTSEGVRKAWQTRKRGGTPAARPKYQSPASRQRKLVKSERQKAWIPGAAPEPRESKAAWLKRTKPVVEAAWAKVRARSAGK